jgi:hypothetical protein
LCIGIDRFLEVTGAPDGVKEVALSSEETREVNELLSMNKDVIDSQARLNKTHEATGLVITADGAKVVGTPGDHASQLRLPPVDSSCHRVMVVLHFHPNHNPHGMQLKPSVPDLKYAIDNSVVMVNVNPRNPRQTYMYRGAASP